MTREQFKIVWRKYYALPWTVSDLDAIAMQIKNILEKSYDTTITGIAIEKTVFEIPSYPALGVRPHASGIVYKYDRGRRWTFNAEVFNSTQFPDRPIGLQLRATGLTKPEYRVSISRVPDGAVEPLPGEWFEGRYYFHVSKPGTYLILVHVRDASLGEQEIVTSGPLVYR